MSTLISELEEKPSLGDGDLVQNILKEMNGVGGLSPQQPHATMQPPPAGGASGVINAGMPNTALAPRVMDPGPATAHIIGGQHPTPADFAQMVQSSAPGFPSGGNWAPAGPSMEAQQAQLAAQINAMHANQGKAWSSTIAQELKMPILIAILVFLVNLPFLSVLVAHYAPWMLKPSGDMNMYGQLAKALFVGGLFWGANRILLPLLG